MVRWRNRRRIKAAQKINHSHSLASVPPLSALPTARPFSRATPFSLPWVFGLSQCLGNIAPSVGGCVCVSGNSNLHEMKLCSALSRVTAECIQLGWAAMITGWDSWLHLVKGKWLKRWKQGFLIAKPLESIGNSACYYVWSPWTPYERWRQLWPRFITLASINSYQLLKSQKVWLSLCCTKLAFPSM